MASAACGCAAAPRRAAISSRTTCPPIPPRAMPSCSRVMGSPDPRQIDGMGGADPLTSKVAVVAKSAREGIDVDYLFLQVFVDQAIVTDAQNCGNILAGIGPFAIERGLVAATGDETRVAIYMENTGQVAVATVQTPGGMVDLRRRCRHRRRAGHPCPDPARIPRHRRFILRRAAADRQCRRCDRGRRLHADRQRHALRRDQGGGRRRDRL